MHLFVESNFVLELVKGQEQNAACHALLMAAEQGRIVLHIPAFCLMEPVYTMGALSKERRAMQRQVAQELAQAERETVGKADLQQLQRALNTVLAERDVLQQELLIEISIRLAAAANLIPLTHAVWLQAGELVQTSALSLTDSLVGASILQRVKQLAPISASSLFVTRDRRAFQLEDIEDQLRASGCEVLFSFHHAAQRFRLL